MSEFKFKAVTKHAGKLKTLFEIIFINLPTANLKIDKTGILLEERTSQHLVLRFFLPASGFEEYCFEGTEDSYYVGLGNNINKEFFKGVKNKDKIIMSTPGPHMFLFEKQDENTTQSLLMSIENVHIIQPVIESYSVNPISLPALEYSQLCRSLTPTKLTVTKQNGQIIFSFKTVRSEKKLVCGTKNTSDLEMIHREFYCEQFRRLSKIQALSAKDIDIYYEENKPLCFVVDNPVGKFQTFICEHPEDL